MGICLTMQFAVYANCCFTVTLLSHSEFRTRPRYSLYCLTCHFNYCITCVTVFCNCVVFLWFSRTVLLSDGKLCAPSWANSINGQRMLDCLSVSLCLCPWVNQVEGRTVLCTCVNRKTLSFSANVNVIAVTRYHTWDNVPHDLLSWWTATNMALCSLNVLSLAVSSQHCICQRSCRTELLCVKWNVKLCSLTCHVNAMQN